jgi:uncharacterized membrane protein
MRSRPSLLARSLEPLAANLWTFFVLVSVLVGVVWTLGLGDAAFERWISHRELRRALIWLLAHLDLLWITLAAANGYLTLAVGEGLTAARRWGITILLGVVALGWVSARTGFPLGPVTYGQSLGFKLGPVPVGLPLLWFSIIVGAREAVLRFPRLSHAQVSAGAGLLGAITDLNLEPMAAKLRGFWFWRASVPGDPPVFDPPLYGCLVWGTMSGMLVFLLREQSVVASARRRSWKPAPTLALFNAIFLAAHIARWIRG